MYLSGGCSYSIKNFILPEHKHHYQTFWRGRGEEKERERRGRGKGEGEERFSHVQQLLQCTVMTRLRKVEWEEKELLTVDITG